MTWKEIIKEARQGPVREKYSKLRDLRQSKPSEDITGMRAYEEKQRLLTPSKNKITTIVKNLGNVIRKEKLTFVDEDGNVSKNGNKLLSELMEVLADYYMDDAGGDVDFGPESFENANALSRLFSEESRQSSNRLKD